MKYIVYINDAGLKLGEIIQKEKSDYVLIDQRTFSSVDYLAIESVIFIGALGICAVYYKHLTLPTKREV